MSNTVTDRDLLLHAAKSAGIFVGYSHDKSGEITEDGVVVAGSGECEIWNPLTDDGDALRLAVQLGITIRPMPQAGSVWAQKDEQKPTTCRNESDIMKAARYAIVLAAHDIGKQRSS